MIRKSGRDSGKVCKGENRREVQREIQGAAKYIVYLTDSTTGAASPIEEYTAADYVRECRENADPEFCEMLEHGEIKLEAIED